MKNTKMFLNAVVVTAIALFATVQISAMTQQRRGYTPQVRVAQPVMSQEQYNAKMSNLEAKPDKTFQEGIMVALNKLTDSVLTQDEQMKALQGRERDFTENFKTIQTKLNDIDQTIAVIVKLVTSHDQMFQTLGKAVK